MVKKVILIISIIFVILFSNVLIAFAATQSELKQQQSDIDSKIKETEGKISEVKEEISDTMKEIQELSAQITDYEIEINNLDSEITKLEGNISETQAKLDIAEKEYLEQEEMLQNRLVALYEAGETTYLDVLLSSSSFSEFISNYYLISEITSYDTEMLDQMEKTKNEIAETKANLEESKKQIEIVKSNKESTANALKNSQATKENYKSKLNDDEKSLQEELDQFERDKVAIQKELAALAAKSNITKEVITSNPSASGYIFPVAGLSRANINNKTYPSYPGHTGIDVNINVTGKSVVAVKDGTVVTSTALTYANGSYRSYGEYVVIDHHDGTMTLYAHMLAGSRTVSYNQSVVQGQVIGTVGSTGNSTGNHLHFEVRVGGSPVNPMPYLP